MRPYWYDELFTLYITRLPDLGTVWRALQEGADLNPPLYYVATRLAVALFGNHEFALRIPSIVGFLTMCVCLRLFVGKRLGKAWGIVAMVIPMISGAAYYAAEARPYGMMVGLVSLAMVFWQRRKESGRPAIMLIVMSMLLACTLLTHCYAVLLMFPFWLAELAKTVRQRRLDFKMLVALSAPFLAVISYLPLLRAVSPVAVKNEVFAPTLWSLPLFYNFLLIGPLPVLICAAVLVHLFPRGQDCQAEGLEVEEQWLAAGLLLLPVLALGLAAGVTHIYFRRYALGAICGLAILLPVVYRWWAGRRKAASVVVAVVLSLGIPMLALRWRGEIGFERGQLQQSLALERVEPHLPLVIGSGLLYFEIDHYASATLAGRMHYLVDDRLARQWTGTDMFDINFPNLHKWFPIRASLEQAEPYLAQHRRFLLYAYEKHPMDWLPSHLRSQGWSLQQLRRDTDRVLYLAVGPSR